MRKNIVKCKTLQTLKFIKKELLVLLFHLNNVINGHAFP